MKANDTNFDGCEAVKGTSKALQEMDTPIAKHHWSAGQLTNTCTKQKYNMANNNKSNKSQEKVEKDFPPVPFRVRGGIRRDGRIPGLYEYEQLFNDGDPSPDLSGIQSAVLHQVIDREGSEDTALEIYWRLTDINSTDPVYVCSYWDGNSSSTMSDELANFLRPWLGHKALHSDNYDLKDYVGLECQLAIRMTETAFIGCDDTADIFREEMWWEAEVVAIYQKDKITTDSLESKE